MIVLQFHGFAESIDIGVIDGEQTTSKETIPNDRLVAVAETAHMNGIPEATQGSPEASA